MLRALLTHTQCRNVGEDSDQQLGFINQFSFYQLHVKLHVNVHLKFISLRCTLSNVSTN